MTSQHIVTPDKIESELHRIWSSIDKGRPIRASLFNLIVFNQLSDRTDYIRTIVQKIIDTFPCRTLFISNDPDPEKCYLKTAVSVTPIQGMGGTICDDIDIGVAGVDFVKVPYVILPHILPDLPVYLLWAGDPKQNHPLFEPLSNLSNRVIFDSEFANELLGFSQTILSLHKEKGIDVADLNWARLESWRDLLASTFSSEERAADLKEIQEVTITFNAKETEYFCHLKIQAMYLLALISSRLGWKVESIEKKGTAHQFHFNHSIEATLSSNFWQELPPGAILSMKAVTKNGKHYYFMRNAKLPHQVTVQVTTADQCELPYQYILGKPQIGHSLVRELFLRGTSPFFIQTLHQLIQLDQGVC